MIKITIFAIIILSSFGCQYEYDIDKHFDNGFTKKVVLNSLLTPDSIIKADLFWSKKADDKSGFKRVEKFSVRLYEDNTLIYEGECQKGNLTTNIHPREGSKYSIVIDVPEYGEVKAETKIPLKASVQIEWKKTLMNSGFFDYSHYTINNISSPQKTRSVMLRSVALYEMGECENIQHFYLSNAYCDEYNSSLDYMDVDLRGSATEYSFRVRMPYKNLGLVSPLNFSIPFQAKLSSYIITGEDEWGRPIFEYVTSACEDIYIIIENPSDEYDKYCKAIYKQNELTGNSDIDIFGQIISVPSNVENGIGIFAGRSQSVHKFKMKK